MEPELIPITIFLVIALLVGIGAAGAISILPRFLKGQAAFYRIYGNRIAFEKEPEPYENLEMARRVIIRENLGIMAAYGVYFLVAVTGLTYLFKGIKYGPNWPYTLFLLAIGIPFIGCLLHIVGKTETQRARLCATGATYAQAGSFVRTWMLLVPSVCVAEVQLLYIMANRLLRQ